ncbi:MAG: uracil-DNA glycosylase [Rickettsiales bacterium]|jgi:DNA polymerase|nr:uracil-DNA glycosylase [Rickettsiales bacterium]
MRAENILKSLSLAGVEWELVSPNSKQQSKTDEQKKNAFVVPRACAAPTSNQSILETAKKLSDQDDIIAAIKSFVEHPLYNVAKNTVPPNLVSDNATGLLVVTDIPSLSDDQTGRILSGIEGELFDKMMTAIGFNREEITISPLVFWRPAGGRTPTADELMFCRPFIEKIIVRTRAEKILTLGAIAAREIAGAVLPRDHGKTRVRESDKITCIPIYKPDFIIANPSVRKDVWEALKQVRN